MSLERAVLGVSAECAALSEVLGRIQAAIGDLIAARDLAPDREMIRTLQEIDCATQSLRGLADMTRLVAPALASRTMPRAGLGAALRLESLAERVLDAAFPDETGSGTPPAD